MKNMQFVEKAVFRERDEPVNFANKSHVAVDAGISVAIPLARAS